MLVGVKFCGGCNPRYDRGKALEAIKNEMQGEAGICHRRRGRSIRPPVSHRRLHELLRLTQSIQDYKRRDKNMGSGSYPRYDKKIKKREE